MTTTLPSLGEPASAGGALRNPLEDELPGFGGLSSPAGHLPLRSMEVKARIVGLDAVVELRQRFANPTTRLAETTYVFPLPARAAVTSFSAVLGGRRVTGELHERQVARQLYDDAIATGHRAGIVEEERPEVFTARVGNLAPGEEATVELTLVHRLPVAGEEATFRFPLVVAPRYVPGVPLEGVPVGEGTQLDTDAAPDASRVTPPVLLDGCPSPVALSLAVLVDPAGLRVSDLRSSLHAVADDLPSGGGVIAGPVRVELRPGERLDRDFLLRLRLDGAELGASAVLVPDPLPPSAGSASRERPAPPAGLEGDGTFLVTLVPPAGRAGDGTATTTPLDLVVVLDRSGSMQGWKMIAARRAAGRIVDALGSGDRFALLAFDNVVEVFSPPGGARPRGSGLLDADDTTRYRAVEWLARLDARGGTELADALDTAFATVPRGERAAAIVLVTDGQVADEDRLVELATRAGRGRGELRVHCVGIDQAVNGGLLERLSRVGGGSCELVESEDRLDEVLVALHRRIRSPRLTTVTLQGEGIEILPGTLSPAGVLDAFPGVPLVVSGRYRGHPAGGSAIVARAGQAAGGPFERRLPLTVSEVTALRAVWGRGRIRDLEDAYAAHGDESVVTAIVSTSLATGVLSRHTAFVAVDEAEIVHRGDGDLARLVQPVELPAGWVAGAAPGAPGAPLALPAMAAAASAPTAIPMQADQSAPLLGAPAGRALRARRAAPAAPAARASRAASPAAVELPEQPDDAELALAASQIANLARAGGLSSLEALDLAIRLAAALLARLRAGVVPESLEAAWRGLVVALLDGEASGALATVVAAADALAALLGPGAGGGGDASSGARATRFWRRLPAGR
jgi:Ca-activated chloride channel family protein